MARIISEVFCDCYYFQCYLDLAFDGKSESKMLSWYYLRPKYYRCHLSSWSSTSMLALVRHRQQVCIMETFAWSITPLPYDSVLKIFYCFHWTPKLYQLKLLISSIVWFCLFKKFSIRKSTLWVQAKLKMWATKADIVIIFDRLVHYYAFYLTRVNIVKIDTHQTAIATKL